MNMQPNLTQINQICGDNIGFRERLVNVIQKELPEEVSLYKKNWQANNYKECAENVHKLKHKISLLGLDEPYRFAILYEEELRQGIKVNKAIFDEIIEKMISYIKNLKPYRYDVHYCRR